MDLFSNAQSIQSMVNASTGNIPASTITPTQKLTGGDLFMVIFVAILLVVVYAFLIMICWNFVVPKLFPNAGIPKITLAHAIVLKILLSLLFNSGAAMCCKK